MYVNKFLDNDLGLTHAPYMINEEQNRDVAEEPARDAPYPAGLVAAQTCCANGARWGTDGRLLGFP